MAGNYRGVQPRSATRFRFLYLYQDIIYDDHDAIYIEKLKAVDPEQLSMRRLLQILKVVGCHQMPLQAEEVCKNLCDRDRWSSNASGQRCYSVRVLDGMGSTTSLPCS